MTEENKSPENNNVDDNINKLYNKVEDMIINRKILENGFFSNIKEIPEQKQSSNLNPINHVVLPVVPGNFDSLTLKSLNLDSNETININTSNTNNGGTDFTEILKDVSPISKSNDKQIFIFTDEDTTLPSVDSSDIVEEKVMPLNELLSDPTFVILDKSGAVSDLNKVNKLSENIKNIREQAFPKSSDNNENKPK